MLLWSSLLGLAFVLGLLRLPWWTVAACPAASLAVGALAVANEPSGYDMHGFGYYVGVVAAVLGVAAWLVGRGLAVLVRWLRTRRAAAA
jgi:hypothetical protein